MEHWIKDKRYNVKAGNLWLRHSYLDIKHREGQAT